MVSLSNTSCASLGQVLLLVLTVVSLAGCAQSKGGKPGDEGVYRMDPLQAGPAAVAAAKELTLELGDKVPMKLVQLPPGEFLMGSPETEKDRLSNETQHKVAISEAFYIAVTEVTVDQFAAFVKDSGYKTDAEKDGWSVGFKLLDGHKDGYQVDGASWRNPGFDQTGNHPVVHISWNDAKSFCEWLSNKSGKTVVLPTEAQWEYACRAGTQMAYPWGNNPDDGKGWANCADQSLAKRLTNPTLIPSFIRGRVRKTFNWDDGFVFTAPVGSFKANAFGLYDMIGNATEYTDSTGHRFPGNERGGSWNDDPARCRAAFSVGSAPRPTGRIATTGFRVTVLE
jgi:formylglycine-generating enzyme required for sulfatase activity